MRVRPVSGRRLRLPEGCGLMCACNPSVAFVCSRCRALDECWHQLTFERSDCEREAQERYEQLGESVTFEPGITREVS